MLQISFAFLCRRILTYTHISLLFLLCSCWTNYTGALLASYSEEDAIITTECTTLADGRAVLPVYRVKDKFYVKGERAMLRKRVTTQVPLDEDLLSDQFLESSECWAIQGPAYDYLYGVGGLGYYEVFLSLYDEFDSRIKTKHNNKTYTSLGNIKCIVTGKNEEVLSDLPLGNRTPVGTGIVNNYRTFLECNKNGTIQRVYEPRLTNAFMWQRICILPMAAALFLVETTHIIVMYPIYMTVQGQ